MSLVGARAAVTLQVTAEAGAAAAFAESLGAPAGVPPVPVTYPIVWLMRPEIVEAVRGLAADRPRALPVHEVQTVETFSPVPLGRQLRLEAALTRTQESRIVVEARVSAPDGAALVRLHAVLRLFG